MNIYVGNLPLEVTEDELRQEFIAFGQVISVSIRNDKHFGNGQPNGYGFVEMAEKSAGEIAIIHLNGNRLRGRVIDVVGALPLSDKSNTESRRGRRNSRFPVKGS